MDCFEAMAREGFRGLTAEYLQGTAWDTSKPMLARVQAMVEAPYERVGKRSLGVLAEGGAEHGRVLLARPKGARALCAMTTALRPRRQRRRAQTK